MNKLERLISDLEKYCRQLTILTFNGGRYDLNLVKKYLYPQLVADVCCAKEKGENCSWPAPIMKGMTLMCLTTDKLHFLDILLYVAPGTNLDKFIRTFNSEEQKGHFLYKLLRRYDDLLTTTEFLPKLAFYSTLKNAHITDDDYAAAQTIWDKLEEKTLLKFIEHYNCQGKILVYTKAFLIFFFRCSTIFGGVSTNGTALLCRFSHGHFEKCNVHSQHLLGIFVPAATSRAPVDVVWVVYRRTRVALSSKIFHF